MQLKKGFRSQRVSRVERCCTAALQLLYNFFTTALILRKLLAESVTGRKVVYCCFTTAALLLLYYTQVTVKADVSFPTHHSESSIKYVSRRMLSSKAVVKQ